MQASHLIVMESAFENAIGVKNTTIKTFQELIFYLLTLNCMSFLLCKPPFSLSLLFSSTVQKMSAIVKPCKDVMVCFHPELFVAPYMYLFTHLNGSWRSGSPKLKRVCEFKSNSSLSQCSCGSTKSKNCSRNGCEDEGFRNLLNDSEKTLLQRAKKDVTGVLKRFRKQIFPHQIPKDGVGSDFSKGGCKEARPVADVQNRLDYEKKRFQSDKLAIQKVRDDIMKKNFEAQKSCQNQIGLLGKTFLEKSLQQGMEIQHQLALADRLLRSAQGMELRQRASFNKLPPKPDNQFLKLKDPIAINLKDFQLTSP